MVCFNVLWRCDPADALLLNVERVFQQLNGVPHLGKVRGAAVRPTLVCSLAGWSRVDFLPCCCFVLLSFVLQSVVFFLCLCGLWVSRDKCMLRQVHRPLRSAAEAAPPDQALGGVGSSTQFEAALRSTLAASTDRTGISVRWRYVNSHGFVVGRDDPCLTWGQ